jgi:hypothetical protein
MKNDDRKTKEPEGHTKNKQKRKDGIIGLLLFEGPRRWPYMRWC